jgi:hypothetical protein
MALDQKFSLTLALDWIWFLALDQNFYKYFGTRSKVLKAKNNIIRTFDLVPKSVRTTLSTRLKVFTMQNNAFKTFDPVPKLDVCTRSKVLK